MSEHIELSDNLDEARATIKAWRKDAKPGDRVALCANQNVRHADWDVLRPLAEEYGLRCIGEDGRYLLFDLPVRQARWEYALEGVEIKRDWRCGDIGCGRNPWPRANEILDVQEAMGQYARPGQVFRRGTLTERLPYDDKFFDFIVCFHVLEHVSDPVVACRELSRVSKAGLIEVPHPMKDGLLLLHETDHRWHVFPPSKPGDPIQFKAIDRARWDRLIDREAQIAAEQVYIHNPEQQGPMAVLRNYFARTEKDWNNIILWKDSVSGMVLP